MVGLGVPGRAKFLQVSVSKLVFTNGKVLTFCFSWGRSMEKSLFHGFLTGHQFNFTQFGWIKPDANVW